LTDDQREKLLKQREQYETAAEKLEDQLLKLKEQREVLKASGNKHEDTIMKDNAKLQKEVKYRIQYMKDYTEKIDNGLAEDARKVAEYKEKMMREKERMREEASRRHRDSSDDSADEKERRKKKKKKEKSRTRSSSTSSDDSDRKKKKKKKKAKARSRSASSDSSDSDTGRNKKMDDELFSMVAELTSKKKKSGGDDVIMDLVTKMSDSYSKIKKENSEISARCVILENQNKVLKRQVEDLQEKLEMSHHEGKESKRSDKEKKKYKSESSDRDEYVEMMKSRMVPAPVPAPVPSPMQPPVVHEPEREKYREVKEEREFKFKEEYDERDKYREAKHEEREYKYKDDYEDKYKEEKYGDHKYKEEKYEDKYRDREDKYDERDRYRDERDRYRDERYESSRYGREDRYREDKYRDDRRERRDRYKEDRRYKEERRSRSRSRDRHSSRHEEEKRSGEKDRSGKDKNEKIDLKEWTEPPEQAPVDPTLASLKEKMKAKEEEAKREEDLRNRWVTKEIEPTPPPEIPKITEQPLPENRTSIKMSWGMGTRKTPDPGPPVKKNPALVGKMPWVKNGEANNVNGGGASAPRRSKFGPPVSVGATIPPPSLVTQAPTLAKGGEAVDANFSNTNNFPPPPPPMLAPPPAAAGGQEQHQQPPPWAGGPTPGQGPPPNNGQQWYGYGGMPPPDMSKPPEVNPIVPKVNRNPKPQNVDMNAMIAAAQQHMQKNLTAKLGQLGVPLSTFGISTQQKSETESIPLPEDPLGVDMDIASGEIPLPGGMSSIAAPDHDGPPGDDDDCAPPGCD